MDFLDLAEVPCGVRLSKAEAQALAARLRAAEAALEPAETRARAAEDAVREATRVIARLVWRLGGEVELDHDPEPDRYELSSERTFAGIRLRAAWRKARGK